MYIRDWESLVIRLLWEQETEGSNPSFRTIFKNTRQWTRAQPYGEPERDASVLKYGQVAKLVNAAVLEAVS